MSGAKSLATLLLEAADRIDKETHRVKKDKRKTVGQMLMANICEDAKKTSPWTYNIAWPTSNDWPYIRVFVQWDLEGAWECWDVPFSIECSASSHPGEPK